MSSKLSNRLMADDPLSHCVAGVDDDVDECGHVRDPSGGIGPLVFIDLKEAKYLVRTLVPAQDFKVLHAMMLTPDYTPSVGHSGATEVHIPWQGRAMEVHIPYQCQKSSTLKVLMGQITRAQAHDALDRLSK